MKAKIGSKVESRLNEDCLVPDCKMERTTRGLCRNHYAYARSLVVSGRTTMKELEANGHILPKKARFNASRDWFLSSNGKK